ncbi:hypothetical protein Taro_027930 [Colocasia esculenta]|uniref:Uncharacterized protein n=1 Tax=Colocasia esculenta TaxID=4460 RepID=A0A843VQA0_COLES|nr:hypothetical protein [Colocasia esculenta]
MPHRVPVLKRYPAKLFVTAFTCMFGLPHFLAIAAFMQTEVEGLWRQGLPSPSSSGASAEDGPWLWRSGIVFSL